MISTERAENTTQFVQIVLIYYSNQSDRYTLASIADLSADRLSWSLLLAGLAERPEQGCTLTNRP